MAKHSFLIESNIQAKDIDALNYYAVADIDVDGGALVKITAPTKKGNDVWTATAPATGDLKDLAIAYNPSEKYLNIGEKVYAGLSLTVDQRDYTNIKKHTFTVFKPQIGDEIDIPAYAIDGNASLVEGDFIEAQDGSTAFVRVASASGSTADTLSFVVDSVWNTTFPQAEIGDEKVKMVHARRVQ